MKLKNCSRTQFNEGIYGNSFYKKWEENTHVFLPIYGEI